MFDSNLCLWALIKSKFVKRCLLIPTQTKVLSLEKFENHLRVSRTVYILRKLVMESYKNVRFKRVEFGVGEEERSLANEKFGR